MMNGMAAEELSSDRIHADAVAHLEKLSAQLRQDEAELSRPRDELEEGHLAEGRRAVATALEAARRLAWMIGKS
jgi:hypothetical protein